MTRRRRGVEPDTQTAFLPTEVQQCLLRAALWTGDERLTSWREWRTRTAGNRPEAWADRLLPLVYRNLRDHESSDPDIAQLKEIYLRTWYANQVSFEALAPVIDALESAGIRPMLLKGAALTRLYYQDAGLRPMEDCDLMVPASRVGDAVRSLADLGWTSEPPRRPSQFTAASQWFVHSWHFVRAGQQLDLHWHLGPECCNAQADADFWGSAVPSDFKQRRVWTLAPGDQLLHVCVHGAEWRLTPSVRWVADAVMILNRAGPTIDWQRLIQLAASHRLVMPLRLTLGYLHDGMRAPVPEWVLDSIASMRTTRREVAEFRIKNQPPGVTGTLHGALQWWARVWWRHVGNVGVAPAVIGIPRMLQDMWELPHVRSVPVELTRRLWRSLRARGAGR